MSHLSWQTFKDAPVEHFTSAAGLIGTYTGDTADICDEVVKIEMFKEDNDVFQGDTAEMSREQAKRIANLILDDLDSYPNRMQGLLSDAATDLLEQRDKLNDLFAEAGVGLTPAGGIGEEHFELPFQGPSDFHDTGMSESERREQETRLLQRAADLEEQFKSIMAKAREIDDILTADLRALDDDLPESPPPVGGADFLEKAATYDAERAAEILSGGDGVLTDGEEGLSQSELNELNDFLEFWDGDPVFSTALMNDIGPDGLVNSLTEIQVSGHTGEFTGGSVNTAHELLGQTLAAATDPRSHPSVSDEWKTDLMNLGDETIESPDGSKQTGYEALAPVLEHGVYDESFIVPVADHILALDNVGLWNDTADDMGHGGNPVDAALTALDHNPDAALDFFHDEPTDLAAMDIDGIYQAVEDPLEYIGGRIMDTNDARLPIDADAFGNAVEAAATGLSSDTELNGDLDVPRHSNYQAAFTDRLIDYALEHENAFTSADGPLNPMMNNLGDITAQYMPDFHQALASAKDGENSWLAESNGIPLALAEGGEENIAKTDQWFELLGHDEQALQTAWAVSEGTMYSEIATASQDGQWKSETEEAISLHAQVSAALTAGGLDGVADEIDADADDHNAQVDTWARLANFGAGNGIGHLDLGPAQGAAAGALASEAINWGAGELKTSAAEVYQQTVVEQEWYQDTLQSAHSERVTEAAIAEMLSSSGHDAIEIEDAASTYSAEYDRLVRRYLSGQDDEAERHIN